MKKRVFLWFNAILFISLLAIVITGCNGGGGGSSGSATLIGGAGAGAVMTGTVYLKDSAGSTEQSTSIDSDGSFVFDVSGLTAPFFLKAVGTAAGKSYTLYSVALQAGTANINPLTHIAVANAAGVDDPKSAYDAPSTYSSSITTTTLDQAISDIQTMLGEILTSAQYPDSNINPIVGSYTPDGTGLDKVFDFVEIRLNPTSGAVTVTDKVTGTKIVSVTRAVLTSDTVASNEVPDSTGKVPTVALKVADEVSVVDARESSGSSKINALKIGLLQLSPSDLPPDSDYYTDETFVFVEERSAEAFNIVNEILCSMAQTRYDVMLNQGNYKAQIDINQCSSGSDSASDAGQQSQDQSSGANRPDYEMWTVNSSRTDNDSPHVVKVWFLEKAEEFEPAKMFFIKGIITEGISEINPYGIFTLNFKSHPVNIDGSVDTSQTMFRGFLKTEKDSATGKVLVKFIVDGGFDINEDSVDDVRFTERITLDRAADGSSGSGSISTDDTFPDNMPKLAKTEQSNYNVAFNTTNFLREDTLTGTQACLSRTDFDETAWRYGLYDSNGSRVSTNSGFPVRYNDGATDYHGWVGFYGLWFPEDVTVPNGATVYRQDYSAGGTTETAYTVFIVGGKLRKNTKKTLTLAEVANIPLMWSQCADQGGGNWSCVQYRVEWNSTDQKLYKTAQMDETNWVWKDIDPATEVTFDISAWDFNFYSESLGGSGRINLRDQNGDLITLSNTTTVVFHIEDTVFPGDADIPTTLACFENCPDPSTIDTSLPYFAASTWQAAPNDFNSINQNVAPGALVAGTNYVSYTFDENTMELKYSGAPAVMTSSANNQNGVWSGAMFEPTAANLSKLACDWDPNATCVWQAWEELDVFYTWETGTEQWNKLTALQSNGSFVAFDPPIPVEYTHTWSDSSTSKFFLEYNGFGDLYGIPGKCVDMDTGQDTDCFDASGAKFIRWIPEITIPDGSEVTDGTDNTISYLVKALEKEQRMQKVNLSDCSSLTLVSYTLPVIADYVNPAIGSRPTVSGAPAVIGGVLQ